MRFDYQSSLYRHRSKFPSLCEAIKASTSANDDTEDGGLSARPAGALEVTDRGTRFVRPVDRRRTLSLLAVGFVCGLVLRRLR